jgi:ribosomal protein S18 acetylase RimI-like enzyme
MLSIAEINQNLWYYDWLDFQVEFRINNKLRCFDIDSFDQVFIGENISFKRAIEQKKRLQCFIDIGEEVEDDFLITGSVSLTWVPEKNECYIGSLWIEPEFRGNGLATYFLNEIINFADELKMILTLHVLPFISPEKKPTDEDISKLKDYYERFGFRRNSEMNVIEFGGFSMERLPRISYDYERQIDHLISSI